MGSRRPLRLAAFALAFSALAGTGLAGQTDRSQADKPLGVVELFTSQGCSSCPPADEFFAELAAKEDIVALAYHVNYWDYLGWQDTLSRKENTERQYDYMRAFGTRSVYTPQAVINGRSHVNGASRREVDGALARMEKSGEGMRVGIKVSRTSDRVMIDTGDAGNGPSDAHVVIVYFDPPQAIDIGKGENSGRRHDLLERRHRHPDRRHVARQGAALRIADERDLQEGRLRRVAAVGRQGRPARADPGRRLHPQAVAGCFARSALPISVREYDR